jgi:hypothetical protein
MPTAKKLYYLAEWTITARTKTLKLRACNWLLQATYSLLAIRADNAFFRELEGISMSTGTAGPEHQKPFNDVVLICIFCILGVTLTAAAIFFGLELL